MTALPIARPAKEVSARSWVSALILRLRTRGERRRQRQALLELSDALLEDIGVSRADAVREGTKPWWR